MSPLANEVTQALLSALQLDNDQLQLNESSSILGSLPEFDSVTVLTVIAGLEKQFGFRIEDDEITAETFQTVQTLTQFVESKLQMNRQSSS